MSNQLKFIELTSAVMLRAAAVVGLFAAACSAKVPLRYERTMVPADALQSPASSFQWSVPLPTLCAILAAGSKAASYSYKDFVCEAVIYDLSNWTAGAAEVEVMSFTGDLNDLNEGIAGYKATTQPPVSTTSSTEDDDSSEGCPTSFSLSPVGCIAITTASSTAKNRDSACKDMGGKASAYVTKYSEFEQLVQWLADQGAPSSQLHVGASCLALTMCGWANFKTIDGDYFPSGEPKKTSSGGLVALALNMDPSSAYYTKLSSVEWEASLRVVCMADED